MTDNKKRKTLFPSFIMLIIAIESLILIALRFFANEKVFLFGIAILSISSFLSYLFFIHFSLLKLSKYISDIERGNFSQKCEIKTPVKAINEITYKLQDFISIRLVNLLQQLKMNVIHTQDNSNEFLSKVQDAVTNSSRISLGADYIHEKVINLEKLESSTMEENKEIRNIISNYRTLVSKQATEIEETGEIIDKVANALNEKIGELNEKRNLSERLQTITNTVSEQVKATESEVTKISDGVDLLNKTISVIASVASETNLLAMNASIEAAHAGDAGHGFAVVAEEIRKLSIQTADNAKNISSALKTMSNLIMNATESSKQSGEAFKEITLQVTDFVDSFRQVIDDYKDVVQRNDEINSHFAEVTSTEKEISMQVENISQSIEKNNESLMGIEDCISEISNIVKQNTNEALHLSRTQDPIYFNAIANGKNLETIRRDIDFFRLTNVPIEIWSADKTELKIVIEAVYAHLNWTVLLLEYLHDISKTIKNQVEKGTSDFDKWLYGEGTQKYGRHPSMLKLKDLNEMLRIKAISLIRLSDADREKEATIEFSEALETSRQMVIELNTIKLFIVKNLTKPESLQQYAINQEISDDVEELDDLEEI